MSTLVSLELHHRISQFLYEEARMLDDWQFRDWLAQLDDDIRYTMRTTVNAQTRDRRKGVQPPTTWIFNDNKDQLERRIARLETGMAWAEEPPSRTRHLISNLQISETDVPDVFAVSGPGRFPPARAWTKSVVCPAMSGAYWRVRSCWIKR